jgi:hypothetical protein
MKKKRKEQKRQKKGPAQARRAAKRPAMPPPESELWPPMCRGQYWTWRTAMLYVGRCQLCAYSCPPSERRRHLDKLTNLPTFLVCTNHPDSPGELRDVLPTEMCRNYRPKCWWPAQKKKANPAKDPPSPRAAPKPKRGVRRIALSQGLFATIDAADYQELSKYKWFAAKRGNKVYAMGRKGRKYVYMHREIMRPRKGYFVDHIDGNGLNNCRSNLRVCTQRQNQANQRPRNGSSRFVGVSRHGNKWAAQITWRGECFYLGLFEDEVEAAKARDRKAYELHGEHAYLNFPEDFRR